MTAEQPHRATEPHHIPDYYKKEAAKITKRTKIAEIWMWISIGCLIIGELIILYFILFKLK